MPSMVRVGLVGDVMLGRQVQRRSAERPPEAVWGDKLDDLAALDGLLINLETVLSTREEEWSDTYRPFHFRADPSWAVPALEAAGVEFACLANNHALDYCEEGLADTMAALDRAGIAHAGAGEDRRAACDPAVVDVGGLRVAVVALTDTAPEYAAGPASPGVAFVEADPASGETREAVGYALDRAEAADPDLVVASLHTGATMATEPGDDRVAFARWLVEEGVDVVHGHSAHVFHGVEVFDGAPVLHDTGNFLDDYAVDESLHNDRSFLFELALDADGGPGRPGTPARLGMDPVRIDDRTVRDADPAVAEWCREAMRRRSGPFGTDGALERDGDGLALDLSG